MRLLTSYLHRRSFGNLKVDEPVLLAVSAIDVRYWVSTLNLPLAHCLHLAILLLVWIFSRDSVVRQHRLRVQVMQAGVVTTDQPSSCRTSDIPGSSIKVRKPRWVGKTSTRSSRAPSMLASESRSLIPSVDYLLNLLLSHSITAACSPRSLSERHITHIVSVCSDPIPSELPESGLKHLRIAVEDVDYADLLVSIWTAGV